MRFAHFMDHNPADDTYAPDPEEPDCADCGSNAHFTGECEPRPVMSEAEERAALDRLEASLKAPAFAHLPKAPDLPFERALAMVRSEAAALTDVRFKHEQARRVRNASALCPSFFGRRGK